MIKQGLKNFISALKYVFTPLGCLFLGAVLGVSVAVPVISSAVTTLADGVNKLLENAAVDINALIDSLADSVYALDWNEPANAVSTLLNREWLTDTFTSNINAFSAETAAHAEETGVLVAGAVDSVVGAFGAVAAFAFVGLTVGYFIVKYLMRREVARRNLPKFLLGVLLDALVAALLIALTVFVTALWSPSFFISIAVIFVLSTVVSLIKAYILFGRKNMRFKELVNFKNIIALIFSDLIVFALCAALITVMFFAVNTFVAVFVGAALIQIALIVISLNAESYTADVAAKNLNA